MPGPFRTVQPEEIYQLLGHQQPFTSEDRVAQTGGSEVLGSFFTHQRDCGDCD